MKRLSLVLLIAGLVICLGGPLVGLACTVFGMIGAFDTLGATGISDPKTLAGHIGFSLMSTMYGLIASFSIGLPLILVALVLHFTTRKPSDPRAIP